jgi:hypothetical protein
MLHHVPYDLIAEQWSRDRSSLLFRERPYLDRFMELAADDPSSRGYVAVLCRKPLP